MAGCAGAGAGKADPAAGAAAAALGFFGFGRIGLRAFDDGAAGASSANTGLGSMMVVGDEAKSPGLRITWTGTVTGWNLGLAKVTEKPASGAGTSIKQGVLQTGPSEVVASAPGGSEFQRNLHHRRRRLEGIERKRRAAGEARSGDGNRDDTTHD